MCWGDAGAPRELIARHAVKLASQDLIDGRLSALRVIRLAEALGCRVSDLTKILHQTTS